MTLTRFNYFLKTFTLYTVTLCLILSLCGCARTSSYGLSTSTPTEINVWTYYSGATRIAFEKLVAQFNSTKGKELGIIVYCQNLESADAMEQKFRDAQIGKIGSDKFPDIFQCYPDNAIEVNNYIGLVNLDDYVPEGEKDLYVKSFLDAGSLYIGDQKQWVIFPVAKSTELLILNETDWNKFAKDTDVSKDNLSTWEGLLSTAKSYYEWSGGHAFLGFDSVSNCLLTADLQLSSNADTLDFDSEVMYKLWEYFYVPYISGYYCYDMNSGYESLKYGETIAAISSSANASYLSDSVTLNDGSSHNVEYGVLTLPSFERTAPYAVLEGAGMAVTQSDETHEYASVMFLEWITQSSQNLQLSAASGYMPVTVDAIGGDYIDNYFKENKVSSLICDTLDASIVQNQKYIMYTQETFGDGFNSLLELAINDREAIDNGADINDFLGYEHFEEWYRDTYTELSRICNQ
jgi:multiple sugar transport system substrate-binding protein